MTKLAATQISLTDGLLTEARDVTLPPVQCALTGSSTAVSQGDGLHLPVGKLLLTQGFTLAGLAKQTKSWTYECAF